MQIAYHFIDIKHDTRLHDKKYNENVLIGFEHKTYMICILCCSCGNILDVAEVQTLSN